MDAIAVLSSKIVLVFSPVISTTNTISMKQIFTFLLIAILGFLATENMLAQPFSGGILLGGNSSQVSGDNFSGFSKAGFSVGAFVRTQVNNKYGFQMELYFTQKGARSNKKAEDAGNAHYLLRLNYVELPLIFQYDLGKLRLEAGLTAAFLTNSYEEINYQPNVNDVWRKLTLNSLFGVRYLISDQWSAGLRTINSINSISTVAVTGNVKRYGNKYGAFNDVLQLALFYTF